jgi:hypothetical protein
MRLLVPRFGFLLVFAAVLAWGAGVEAQTYRWTDAQGQVHYSGGIGSVPEQFRSSAQPLAYPTVPAAPEPSKEPAAPPGAEKIPFKPGSPILVSAKINGDGPVTLILDTGADTTVVNPLALWRVGVSTWFAPRAEIRGATGTQRVDVVQVQSIEVGQAKMGPLTIIAHDVEIGEVDGLLGRDFLNHFNVNIDTSTGVVTLSPR